MNEAIQIIKKYARLCREVKRWRKLDRLLWRYEKAKRKAEHALREANVYSDYIKRMNERERSDDDV